MSTLPFISQIKSPVQVCTGDVDGARKTWNEFTDAWTHHPGKTIGDIVDGIPVVGHIKGIVHFAMGDTEEGIEAEESATRSLAVIGAAALAGATGGATLPVLAAVVAGVAADGITTGIESARHHKYDPQGMIGVGTNVVKDFSQKREDRLGGDVFDGVVIAASDGLIGKGGVKIRAGATTRIFRVEGKSLIRQGDGSRLGHFIAGDNQRIFYHNGEIAPRERLPPPSTAESLPTAHIPLEPEPRPRGPFKGGDTIDRPDFFLRFVPDFFDDSGKMIFLNFGEEDRMYAYYAQKLLDHRDLVKKYKELYHGDVPSNVTEKAHDIRVKSFEASVTTPLCRANAEVDIIQQVLTRDLDQIEKDAITERQKQQNPESYRGVLNVDLKAPRQYGLTSNRYTPIFSKVIKDTFRSEPLWIRHLPTTLPKLINEHPVAFGKIRTFKYAPVAAGAVLHGRVPIRDVLNITTEEVSSEDVAPLVVAHCRHVKTITAATEESPPDVSEHYEYLDRFDEESQAEWYPETLVSKDLQDDFYKRAMASAQPVHSFDRSDQGKLIVQRPSGSWDEIEDGQIFWNEQASGENPLGMRELDAILCHMYRNDSDAGPRISLATDDAIPALNIMHNPPCADPEGQPVYLASALDFKGGVHPCKVAPHLRPGHCRVSYGGAEVVHQGRYELLPFSTELMEFVDTQGGQIPAGRRVVLGGYEDGKPLYHALVDIDGVMVPGKAAPHLVRSRVLKLALAICWNQLIC
ncbi:hypothetical protein BDN71DRAFT_1381516 [Pleurotus eryngii]|uniref:Uncharacterized protein n=1 Tax=Pleurotus eryngii TaxID=5323 RepID=A0A9P6A6A0_PLEER|nr:hypothetical protein BDN71DRAFT_1381516 [Pleurotus eryngii]